MRLFIAIELNDTIRSALSTVQEALRPRCVGVRWVRPEQLHLTVKFLGEVRDRDVPGLTESLERAAGASTAFDMMVQGCGCFPKGGPVRIVWAGADETEGHLLQCVEHVEGELESLGFPRERRPFSPHITIGRVREDRSGGRIRQAVDAHVLEPYEQSVGRLTLMQSVLSPKGPTYTPISYAKLG